MSTRSRRVRLVSVGLVAAGVLTAGAVLRISVDRGPVLTADQVCAGIRRNPQAWSGRVVHVYGPVGDVTAHSFWINGAVPKPNGPWFDIYVQYNSSPVDQFLLLIPGLRTLFPVQEPGQDEHMRGSTPRTYRLRIERPQYDPSGVSGGSCETGILLGS